MKNIDEIMEMTLLRKHETGLPVNFWVYELNHYRLNFMNNPVVYQGFALNELSEYRIMTISGLKSIKKHALYKRANCLAVSGCRRFTKLL
jgi:hypothetical protein